MKRSTHGGVRWKKGEKWKIVTATLWTAAIMLCIFSVIPYFDKKVEETKIEPIVSVEKQSKVDERQQKIDELNKFKEGLLIDKETLNYFIDISLGGEFGDPNRILTKWHEQKVSISTFGNISEEDKICLNEVVFEFNELSKTSKLILTDTEEENDIDIHFISQKEFKNIFPDSTDENDGFVTAWFFDSKDDDYFGEIYKAIIAIDRNINPTERCEAIREELTQGMGLTNDSVKYKDSIFYEPYRINKKYSEMDKELIQMMYSTQIKSGIGEDEIRSYFKNNIKEKDESNLKD